MGIIVSLVIPCFNEEAALPLFFKEIYNVIGSLNSYEFELIFVDDGSSDRTLSVLSSPEDFLQKCS